VGWTFVRPWAQNVMIGLQTFCHIFPSKAFDKLFLKVGAKFGSLGPKKVWLVKFVSHISFLERWTQSFLAHGIKKLWFVNFFGNFSIFKKKVGMKFSSPWTKKSCDSSNCFSSSMIHEDSFLGLHEIICYIFWLHHNIFAPQWSLFSLYITLDYPSPHLNGFWIFMGWPLDEFWTLSTFPLR
jgi:hypothetical protein